METEKKGRGRPAMNQSELFILVSDIGGKITAMNENITHMREQGAILRERIDQNQHNNEEQLKHLEEKMQLGLQNVTEKLSNDRESIQKLDTEVGSLRAEVTKFSGELAKINAETSNSPHGTKIDVLEKKVEEQSLILKDLQETKAKATGAMQAGQALWGILGGVIVAAIIAALKF